MRAIGVGVGFRFDSESLSNPRALLPWQPCVDKDPSLPLSRPPSRPPSRPSLRKARNSRPDLSPSYSILPSYLPTFLLWRRRSGLAKGMQLILTKPIGTGTLFAARMRGAAQGGWLAAATESMVQSNAKAAAVLADHGARACTDVTGFGLLGHLYELCSASQAKARVRRPPAPPCPPLCPPLCPLP